MDDHAKWLELTSHTGLVTRPMRVVFTRQAVDQMTEYSFLDLHDVVIHPVHWDTNFDALIFYLLEDSWCWLVLKHPELAQLRWKPHQKP